jgi:phenylacetate-CoA ligase
MNAVAFPDRAAIQAHQLEALQAMIAEIVPANRFYTRKLAGSDPAGWGSLDAFFAETPFTFKQELVEDQRASPPFGTNLTYPLERYVRFSQTSGTTGAPLRWLDTPKSWSWMGNKWVQVLTECGVGAEDRLFFAFSFGPFLGFWTAFEAAVRLGCLCVPGGGMSSAARLRAILDNEITVLCCTPTYAIRLAEVAAEEGIDLAQGRIRLIFTAGEPGACIPATRARIEALWPGARVRDQHGMTETGPVTFECRARAGTLHVMESGFIPEVIDPSTGQAVGPGAEGELVLTNLGRVGSPLIRYRTGDIVRRAAAELCACGRYDLALEGGIRGRTDDMVIVRSVNLYPSAVEEVVRAFDHVAEYRVEVTAERAMTELRLQLEPAPECPDAESLRQSVEAALRTAFNLRIPVTLVPSGALPRFELKARRWVKSGE